jgi:hypothetical protein
MSTSGQPSPRSTRGIRPEFFEDPAIDQLYAVMLEMAAELSAARDRIDTLERLLEQQGVLGRDLVEGFEPDAQAEAERTQWREDYLDRLFRVFSTPRDHDGVTGQSAADDSQHIDV